MLTHLHARHQSVRNHGLIAIRRNHLHGLQERTVPVSGSYTHTAVVAPLLAQRSVGSLMAANPPGWYCRRRHCAVAKPKGRLGGIDVTRTAKVRVTRIGAGRHLAHLPPAASRHQPRNRTVTAWPTFRCTTLSSGAANATSRAHRLRNAQHRCARAHHLADLGLHASDHAVGRRHQLGIGSLVALRRSLRRACARLSGGSKDASPVSSAPLMKFCASQGPKPLEVGRRQIMLRLRHRHLGLRPRPMPTPRSPRIGWSQHLPSTHALPQFGLALHDLR